ncbi:hypothetical protein SynPROSU1_01405 [Synechococcus sp. PROS-U-1]|nr:hypothetical protein SynPROSU1_01405 [Synechococcus sp. PROS-U-1]
MLSLALMRLPLSWGKKIGTLSKESQGSTRRSHDPVKVLSQTWS